jgi:hypothetical protein
LTFYNYKKKKKGRATNHAERSEELQREGQLDRDGQIQRLCPVDHDVSEHGPGHQVHTRADGRAAGAPCQRLPIARSLQQDPGERATRLPVRLVHRGSHVCSRTTKSLR